MPCVSVLPEAEVLPLMVVVHGPATHPFSDHYLEQERPTSLVIAALHLLKTVRGRKPPDKQHQRHLRELHCDQHDGVPQQAILACEVRVQVPKATEYWPRSSSSARAHVRHVKSSMLRGEEQQEDPTLSQCSQGWRTCESQHSVARPRRHCEQRSSSSTRSGSCR